MTRFLALAAYRKLLHFELYLARRNFGGLYDEVRGYPRREKTPHPLAIEQICAAVDLSCIWYWKVVLCLQRSAATTCLLKDAGLSARMVIGVQQVPFRAHAWVEVEGRAVNDKPYIAEMYAVLDRC